MNDIDAPPTLPPGSTKPPAKTNAQRQAALRLRRQQGGRTQVPLWLTAEEHAKVKALLAGQPGADSAAIAAERDLLAVKLETARALNDELLEDVRKRQNQALAQDETIHTLRLQLQQAEHALKNSAPLAAERDALAARLEKTRTLNDELLNDVRRYRDEIQTQDETIQALRLQLQKAEADLKQKPAKTFAVPELADRRAVIAKAMSFEKGFSWEEGKEMNTAKLKTQSGLAKKFATDIKQARSRLAGLVAIVAGAQLLEQSKNQSMFGSWNKFDPPIVSPAEQSLLLEACTVMSRIERDVERAGSDVDKLHKKREAEDQARWAGAGAALDAALFNSLDRRGEVLFVTAAFGDHRWGSSGWDELLDGVKGERSRFMNAAESFRRALSEAKGRAISHVADNMKSTGKSAEELATEIAEKYRHPDTREKHGALADQVTAFLVSEQLAGSK